ncbi:protein jagged-1-like [Lytechinus variegatus]|uniref:protein jagged-1-like n=1 Tax=Lytechinus variegatus TaxID=7654 RepID=UPI001BB10CD5|nr:protein jagged-1-like [Lytechinus variegatus]
MSIKSHVNAEQLVNLSQSGRGDKVDWIHAHRHESNRCMLRDCLSSPCMNDGICQETFDGYICRCAELTQGPRCETVMGACGCLNDGVCSGMQGGFRCDCLGGWGGERCQIKRPASCQAETCLNGGTCYEDPDIGFYCLCTGCFYGEFCEREMSPDEELLTGQLSSEPETYPTHCNHIVTMEPSMVLPIFLRQVYATYPTPDGCPYRYSTGCFWNINAPAGKVITIMLYSFNLVFKYEIFAVHEGKIVYDFDKDIADPTVYDFASKYDIALNRSDGMAFYLADAPAEDSDIFLFVGSGDLTAIMPLAIKTTSTNISCVFFPDSQSIHGLQLAGMVFLESLD